MEKIPGEYCRLNFDIGTTLNCGECFCWRPDETGYHAVLGGKMRHLSQNDTVEKGSFLFHYLDMAYDYEGAMQEIAAMDPLLQQAVAEQGPLHLLNQDLWETIIGFILSQNNNIKRIMGLYDALSCSYGTAVDGGYTFPTPSQMQSVTEAELRALRLGFRAGYVLDAIQRSDELLSLKEKSFAEADAVLQKTKGIGPKVSACIRLFGLHDLSSFPQDVWIKRVMSEHFQGKDETFFAPYQGLAQQYLFTWIRQHYQR